MKWALAIISLHILLLGCAATGPKYSELAYNINSITTSKARVVIFRTEDSQLYVARSAPMYIDDKKIGECPVGSFIYTDISECNRIIR